MKALFISSRSLYENFVNKPKNEKQYQKLKEALLKFFLRSTLRTTPYGYFAAVGLGMLMLSLAVMISLCHADMRLPGYLSWNVSCDGAAIRPYHGRA